MELKKWNEDGVPRQTYVHVMDRFNCAMNNRRDVLFDDEYHEPQENQYPYCIGQNVIPSNLGSAWIVQLIAQSGREQEPAQVSSCHALWIFKGRVCVLDQ